MPTDRTTINGQVVTLPYTISTPGSYVLTSNLIAVPGHPGSGIVIDSDDVTLDLNGFSIVGVPGSDRGIDTGGSNCNNISISNGVVRDWGSLGVNASRARSGRFRNLFIYNNGSTGLNCGSGAVVSQCVSRNNGLDGFKGSISIFSHCAARDNSDDGFDGGMLFDQCVAYSNGKHGFDTSASSIVRNCAASENSKSGIAAFMSRVDGCIAFGNNTYGIRTDQWRCTIVNNQCGQNSLAGIFVPRTGVGSRIQNNHVLYNGVGIDVDGTDNFVIGNTAYNNSGVSFLIVSGNHWGFAELDPGTLFVNDRPWSNFIFNP